MAPPPPDPNLDLWTVLFSEWRGSLTQNCRKIGRFVVVIPVVLPRPLLTVGVFYAVAVSFFSKSVFGRGLKIPKMRGSVRKKMVHLYCSTRLTKGVRVSHKSLHRRSDTVRTSHRSLH